VKVHDEQGQPLDAGFSVEERDGQWSVVLESRGGTRGTSQARNVDYIPGMELLLRRLGQMGMRLVDAAVESARVASMPIEKRRLLLRYPIELREQDAMALGRSLRAAQGSNPTRRVRLYLERGESGGEEPRSAAELGGWLAVGLSGGAYEGRAADSRKQLPVVAEELVAYGEFDVTNAEDARKRTRRAIAVRQGQPLFRRMLLEAYASRCAISGCDVLEVLEAAHIRPFRGSHTNHIQNGILLRADLHTLFDLGLISIDAERWTVLLSPRLRQTDYGPLDGQPVRRPEQRSAWPHPEVLLQHRRWAGL